MQQQAGERFGSKYILLNRIGSGGMAEVYRSRLTGSEGFEKIVVLKRLLAEAADDPELVATFIDEARLTALLQHENIAQVYDFGEESGSYYLAMEYLWGQDLFSVMKASRTAENPFAIDQALLITARICSGMAYAHSLKDLQQRSLNLIHRDLSPHNVFITYDGKVKIIDFGVAKAELFDNRTRAGMVKGKVSYMSPEQLSGEAIDHRSDIFSIGILFYEMLSGRRLYTGDTASLIRKCLQADYEPLRLAFPGLPEQVYHISERALAHHREDRYHDCEEMQREIEECLYQLGYRADNRRLAALMKQLFAEGQKGESELGALQTTPPPGSREKASFTDTFATVLLPAARDLVRRRGYRLRQGGLLAGAALLVIVGGAFFGWQWGAKDEPGGQEVASQIQLAQPVPPVAAAPESRPAVITSPPPGDGSAPVMVLPEPPALEELLEKAEIALAANRFTVPAHDSAYTYYQQAKSLAPDDNRPTDGLRRLAERYAEFAEAALVRGDYDDASQQLEKGLYVEPENGRLKMLWTRLEGEKSGKIEEQLRLAEQALERNDLSTPAGASAVDHFRRVLAIDPSNVQAQDGLGRVCDRYATLANEAYINMNIKKAKRFVELGLAIEPNHRALRQLHRDLQRSKPGMFFKSLEKNFEKILN